MPTTSREFQRAARQRLLTAEFLLKNGYNLDAMYLAVYTIECALKALILQITLEPEREEVLERITHSAKMHEPETLKGLLKGMGCNIPLRLVERLRRSD